MASSGTVGGRSVALPRTISRLQQVVLWLGQASDDQFAEVALQPPGGRVAGGLVGVEADQHLAVALEGPVVVVGHAEQLADHQRWDRQREVPYQVGARPGEHRVDVPVGDPLDGRSQRLHPSHGELADQEPSQPCVLFAVQLDHRARGRVAPVVGGQHVHRSRAAGAQPGIREHAPDVLVAADQPCVHPGRAAHRGHGRVGAQPGVDLVGVEGAGIRPGDREFGDFGRQVRAGFRHG